MTRKIGLLGPYGTGNLGDAAVQEAVMYNLRNEMPDAVFVGISLNPGDTRARHGIDALPARRSYIRAQPVAAGGDAAPAEQPAGSVVKEWIRAAPPLYRTLRFVQELWLLKIVPVFAEAKFLFKSYRELRGFHALLVSGGGQLNEYWGGPWAHPYTLFKWVVLARLARVRMLIVNVGVGQFEHRLSRFFIRNALKWSEFRSLRDVESQRRVALLGDIGKTSVHPDQVFGLPVAEFLSPPRRHQVVGINPLPYYDPRAWPEKDAARYHRYIDKLAALTLGLAGRDFRVRLVPTQINMDRLAIDDLADAVRAAAPDSAGEHLEVLRLETLEELLRALEDCDVLVASRLHGMLIAHLLRRPVLAISPDPKLEAHLRALDQLENCMSADDFDVDAAVERCVALHDNAPELGAGIDVVMKRYREDLSALYGKLFGAEGGGRG